MWNITLTNLSDKSQILSFKVGNEFVAEILPKLISGAGGKVVRKKRTTLAPEQLKQIRLSLAEMGYSANGVALPTHVAEKIAQKHDSSTSAIYKIRADMRKEKAKK